MRNIAAFLLFLCALIGCGKPTPELNGYWKGVSYEGRDGEKDDLLGAAFRLNVSDEKLTLYLADAGGARGVILYDGTKSPKSFEARVYDQESTFDLLGICERKGDELKLCYAVRKTDSEEEESTPVKKAERVPFPTCRPCDIQAWQTGTKR